MIRKILGVAVLPAALVASCTTVQQQTSVSTPLRASQYNDIASQYHERPTFVSLQIMSDGATVLRVTMDEYGYGASSNVGQNIPQNYAVAFDSRDVDQYLVLIAKYEEWESLASSRGDMIEKDIGDAPTWAIMGSGKLHFSMFSGNAQSHYLVIGFCMGACVDERLMFDRLNAARLKKLLEEFKAGDLQQLDVDAVYK